MVKRNYVRGRSATSAAALRNGSWEVVSEEGSAFSVVRSRLTDDERKGLSVDRRLSDIKTADATACPVPVKTEES